MDQSNNETESITTPICAPKFEVKVQDEGWKIKQGMLKATKVF